MIAGRVVELISIDWESSGIRRSDSLDSLTLSIWDIIYQIGDSNPTDEVNYLSVRDIVIRCKRKRLHIDDDGSRS